jgi:hypothetical protein
MRRIAAVLGSVVLLCAGAAAQDENKDNSKVDVMIGYSLVNFEPGEHVSSATFNGGLGSVAFNINRYVAAVGEVSGYHNGNVNDTGTAAYAVTYMGGPKFTFHIGRWAPFAQALFGGAHGHSDIDGATASQTAFAAVWGGGIDFNFTRHMAVRIGQVDDLYTRFNTSTGFGSGGSGSQNSLQFSTGVVFHF